VSGFVIFAYLVGKRTNIWEFGHKSRKFTKNAKFIKAPQETKFCAVIFVLLITRNNATYISALLTNISLILSVMRILYLS
jgi:hypothetical protein